MKSNLVKRMISLVIMTTTVLGVSSIGVSAEWKQIDGKWYYFGQDGYMAHDTIVDSFKIDNNGVWIQNTTNNNVNSNTVNATSNVENKVDNSITNANTTTLNNTGSINNGIINNGTVNNDTTVVNTTNVIVKKVKSADDTMNDYYKTLISQYKDKLADAKLQLEKAKNQKSVKTYVNGQFVYTADQTAIDSAEKNVEFYQNLIDKYNALIIK